MHNPISCHLTSSIAKKYCTYGAESTLFEWVFVWKQFVEFTYLQRAFYAFKQIITLSLKLDAVVVVAIQGYWRWGAKEKNGSTPTFLLQPFLVSCYVAPPGSWLRRELLAVLQLTTCLHRLLKMRMARGDSKALSQNQPKLSCPLDMILVMKTVITMIMLVNCDTMSQKN